MGYKLTYKETILEEFRDSLSFNFPTSSEELQRIFADHKKKGNIIEDGGYPLEFPYTRTCWIVYKDKETADAVIAEMSAVVPDITRSVEGVYAHDLIWEEI